VMNQKSKRMYVCSEYEKMATLLLRKLTKGKQIRGVEKGL
jgi:hypothetical protein